MSDHSSKAKRYQCIDFPEHRLRFDYYSNLHPVDVPADTPPAKASDRYRTALGDTYHSVLHAWLMDETVLAVKWCWQGIPFAEGYFWGSWRDLAPAGNIRDRQSEAKTMWDTSLVEALHLAVMIDQWIFIDKLAMCPSEDMHILCDTKSNQAWLLLLCRAIAKRPWVDIKHHFDLIQSQPQKREKLLARMLQSLVQGTDEELLKSTKEYFAYFKKSESKSEYITRMLPIDASIVFHVARHWQRPLPVPADFRDHIIELPIPASEG